MDTIFWICVKIMQLMSNALGITYQLLNVILFVILHPAITVILYLKKIMGKPTLQQLISE